MTDYKKSPGNLTGGSALKVENLELRGMLIKSWDCGTGDLTGYAITIGTNEQGQTLSTPITKERYEELVALDQAKRVKEAIRIGKSLGGKYND